MGNVWKREERTKELRASWLSGLKAGDRVFIPAHSTSWDSSAGDIRIVERLTSKQICLQGMDVRYRRDDGSAVGQSRGYYSPRAIQPFTADANYAVELGKARGCIAKLGDYRTANKLADATIFALAKIYTDSQAKPEAPDSDWLAEQGAYVVFEPAYNRHFVRWADGAEQSGRYASDVMAVTVAKGAQQMGMARCGMPLCTDAQHHPCCPSLFKDEANDA